MEISIINISRHLDKKKKEEEEEESMRFISLNHNHDINLSALLGLCETLSHLE